MPDGCVDGMFTPDQTDLGGVHVRAGQCSAGEGRRFMISLRELIVLGLGWVGLIVLIVCTGLDFVL
jgi:hypothetical protein